MHKTARWIGAAIQIVTTSMLAYPTHARAGRPWIHTHVHVITRGNQAGVAVESARAAFRDSDIHIMVVMPPPQPNSHMRYSDIYDPIRAFPDRFGFMGGGDSLNPKIHQASDGNVVTDRARRRFRKIATGNLKAGTAGFGEIAA
jgi:hypothetical protein